MLELISQFGGLAALVTALFIWQAKVTEQRIARTEKAELDRQLEELRQQLKQIADERLDAVSRRRDIYSKLVTAIRVFVDSNSPPSQTDKQNFLKVYDESHLWASEGAIHALRNLVEIMQRNSEPKGSVTQTEMKNAYIKCVLAMRRDSGFPESQHEYFFVTFR